MNLNEMVKGAVKTAKKKAAILRLISDLDDVVFTIYTDKKNDEVIIKAKIKEGNDEIE